jgi:endonuclease YncB( thermonuclease family)
MSSPGSPTAYLVVPGEAVLVGKQPDGDSVRFRPDDPDLLGRLEHGDRVDPAGDGTVQLRFDGIDAPELHYQGRAQPRGDTARDDLLAHLGFTGVRFRDDGATVTASTPRSLPLVILSRLVEVNGRPVAVVFAGADADRLGEAAGGTVELDEPLLARSVNVWEVGSGVAYPLLYTSTAPAVRAVFTEHAGRARDAALGVWAQDSSSRFPVAAAADLGPGGALVLPKLFRRAVDYLRERSGPEQTLPAWLAEHPADQDDRVLVAGTGPQPLHTLLQQSGDEVTLSADPLDLVFVER